MANRYPSNYPKVLTNGYKGHVWDEDGKEYIDLISGLGAISVGYSNGQVNRSVEDQLERGVSFSLPTRLEWEAAETLTQLVPGTDMWRFGKTGTDGVLMAVRAARAFTGRTKILTSGYHGCNDQFESLNGTRRAGMLDLHADIQHIAGLPWSGSRDYAAVVLEPWILEQQYSQKLREWCDTTGTLLIADEVVTGGRFEGFTASAHIEVVPDLYVLGKGLANGFPLCAVGGTRRIMETFERDDFFASGTFGGETVSLAAFLATEGILRNKIKQMIWNGSRIQEAFNKVFKDAKCVGYPTRLDFQFDVKENKWIFWQEMCKRGILIGYNNFIMADHTEEDVTKIINAIYETFNVMGVTALEGDIPTEAIKRG
jgi:glutamate-1-semialdehyde aminotransferase